MLAGVLDPDYQGEIGLELHDGDKGKGAWDTGDLLLDLLVLTMPTDSGQRKSIPSNPGRTSNGPDPSGIKVWVTTPGKEP